MLDAHLRMIDQVYTLIQSLPRFDYQTQRERLPENGVYLFFERGEVVQYRNMVLDRIVRVGTHKKDGRFRDRIRQHYGNVHSLDGNKNSSIFRKHLGGALLRKANPQDPRLKEWLTQDGPSFAEVEEMVSRVLRKNFTSLVFV